MFLQELHCIYKNTSIRTQMPAFVGISISLYCMWVGGGGFSKVVATFNHVDGSVNLFMATTGDV